MVVWGLSSPLEEGHGRKGQGGEAHFLSSSFLGHGITMGFLVLLQSPWFDFWGTGGYAASCVLPTGARASS